MTPEPRVIFALVKRASSSALSVPALSAASAAGVTPVAAICGENQVEIVGVIVERVAGLHRERAGGGDRAGEHEFAVREEVDAGVEAGLHRDRRAGGIIEGGAAQDGRADVEVQVGGRLQGDDAAVARRGDRAAAEDGEAGTAVSATVELTPSTSTVVAILMEPEVLTVMTPLSLVVRNVLPRVGGEAVRSVAIADEGADARGAVDVDGEGVAGAEPAADEDLLGRGKLDARRGEAGVGQTERLLMLARLISMTRPATATEPVAWTSPTTLTRVAVSVVGSRRRARKVVSAGVTCVLPAMFSTGRPSASTTRRR